MKTAREKAEHFLNNETQFHLGTLPTEQFNLKTSNLSDRFRNSIEDGIRCLQSVDRDIVPMAKKVYQSKEFCKLISGMRDSLGSGGKIVFSGCGATGRLSILLEACWRKFWRNFKMNNREAILKTGDYEDHVFSIMTGGDYALVRSVEKFEDYFEFGRQQVKEMGISQNDSLVAITEGGETSSVLGTLDKALDMGAKSFLMFNNPANVLCKHIERSRKAIENPEVTVLDLFCGSMAVTGSTRMQAATAELLIAGTALEQVLYGILRERLSEHELAKADVPVVISPAKSFVQLLKELEKWENVKSIAAVIDKEENIYRHNGLVTYYADDLLLDIFTDTTERAPTFNLPPFRKCDDMTSPPSWAFVKNLLCETPETWQKVFAREPRCLDWPSAIYRKMGAEKELVDAPPLIDRSELYKFIIGKERDSSRLRSPSLALLICSGKETWEQSGRLLTAFDSEAEKYDRSGKVIIGGTGNGSYDIEFPISVPDSPLQLISRLAVKLIFNVVSTGTMVRMGRVTGNCMSWAETSNKKLIDRNTRFISQLCGLSYYDACEQLFISMHEIDRKDWTGKEKPSTVQYTINRIRNCAINLNP